jgi:hypothetical protein
MITFSATLKSEIGGAAAAGEPVELEPVSLVLMGTVVVVLVDCAG